MTRKEKDLRLGYARKVLAYHQEKMADLKHIQAENANAVTKWEIKGQELLVAEAEMQVALLECQDLPPGSVTEAVREAYRRAAQKAWEMQQRDFGGGTAIGNAMELLAEVHLKELGG
jgi:hypothetical protein